MATTTKPPGRIRLASVVKPARSKRPASTRSTPAPEPAPTTPPAAVAPAKVWATPDIEVIRGPVTLLTLDSEIIVNLEESINRRPDEGKIDKLTDGFDPLALGSFKAWLEPVSGMRVLIDGQHRYLTCLKVGYEGDVTIEIYKNLTRADAARLFRLFNDTRAVNWIDKFRIALVGDRTTYPIEHGVNDVLQQLNLQVGWENAKTNGNQVVMCPQPLMAAYKRHGAETFEQIIGTLLDAFENEGAFRAITVNTVRSLSEIVWRYRNEERQPDLERMALQLSDIGLDALLDDYQANYKKDKGYSRNWHLANVMVNVYNEGLARGKKLTAWLHISPARS